MVQKSPDKTLPRRALLDHAAGAVGPKIVIVGVGGIGGVLATTWAKHGVDRLHLVTPNEQVRAAWKDGSVTVDGVGLDARLPAEQVLSHLAHTDLKFDLAFLAVQPDQLSSALEALAPRLGPNAEVITLTNGLCDEEVAAKVGEERAIGAVVMWGARMPEPGRYLRTSKGGFVVGKLSGARSGVSQQTLNLLGLVGPTRVTNNLLGARFSKLALNSAISTLGTIGGDTLGHLLMKRPCRALALAIVDEAVSVAHAQGIRLESVTPLDMEWLADGTSSGTAGAVFRHLGLLLVGFRYRRLRSSMLAAVERGRAPAVDFLNGEIARRGATVNVRTPVNEAARELVWQIATGRAKAGPSALASLLRQAKNTL